MSEKDPKWEGQKKPSSRKKELIEGSSGRLLPWLQWFDPGKVLETSSKAGEYIDYFDGFVKVLWIAYWLGKDIAKEQKFDFRSCWCDIAVLYQTFVVKHLQHCQKNMLDESLSYLLWMKDLLEKELSEYDIPPHQQRLQEINEYEEDRADDIDQYGIIDEEEDDQRISKLIGDDEFQPKYERMDANTKEAIVQQLQAIEAVIKAINKFIKS